MFQINDAPETTLANQPKCGWAINQITLWGKSFSSPPPMLPAISQVHMMPTRTGVRAQASFFVYSADEKNSSVIELHYRSVIFVEITLRTAIIFRDPKCPQDLDHEKWSKYRCWSSIFSFGAFAWVFLCLIVFQNFIGMPKKNSRETNLSLKASWLQLVTAHIS